MNRSLFRAWAEPFGFVPASERGVEREVLAPLLQSRPAEPKTEQGIRHSRRVLGTADIYVTTSRPHRARSGATYLLGSTGKLFQGPIWFISP